MIKRTTEFVGDEVDNRYAYDFGLCSSQGDWAQMDTGQDAPWFGQWANRPWTKSFAVAASAGVDD